MPTWSESAGLRYASLGAHTQCPHAYLRVYSARARLSPGADVAIDAGADVGLQVSTQKRLVKAMFVIWHGVVSR